jgi:hypothetical protein
MSRGGGRGGGTGSRALGMAIEEVRRFGIGVNLLGVSYIRIDGVDDVCDMVSVSGGRLPPAERACGYGRSGRGVGGNNSLEQTE